MRAVGPTYCALSRHASPDFGRQQATKTVIINIMIEKERARLGPARTAAPVVLHATRTRTRPASGRCVRREHAVKRCPHRIASAAHCVVVDDDIIP